MVTDSRNVSYAIIITLALLIFKDFVKSRVVYRLIYGFAILYPAIFPQIAKALEETKLYKILVEITVNVYEKDSGLLSGRGVLYDGAQELINESIFGNLFGYGRTLVSFYATHNDYYLVRYTFGLIGTVIIAIVMIIFFEKAYKLIRTGDDIAYGCFAIIVSVFFSRLRKAGF